MKAAKAAGAELRFIEYMDVGGATRWSSAQVVTRSQILEQLAAHYGAIEPVASPDITPAERFVLDDGTVFGIISSVSRPFCQSCRRSRLTADGTWLLCLYAPDGIDLRAPLRAGASAEELAALLTEAWRVRAARTAEERAALAGRGPAYESGQLAGDPRLEMHTRGG